MKIKNLKLKILLPIILALSPLFIAASLLFLKDPPVWPDEGTSLYMAKSLLSTGRIDVSDYYIGVPVEAGRAGLGFPPLYFATLGVWTSVFGESIEEIRALSLIIGIVCLIVFYLLCRRIFNTSKVSFGSFEVDVFAFLATLLLSTNVIFARAARFGRPEILTLLFILLTLFFWFRSKHLRGGLGLLGGGMSAALAFATHPTGLLASIIPAVAILSSILLTPSKKSYIIYDILTFASIFLSITVTWIFMTQESLGSLIHAWELGSVGKLGQQTNLLDLFLTGGIRSAVSTFGIIIPVWLFAIIVKKKLWSLTFVPILTVISIVWALVLKEGYYFLFPQPFIILSLVLLVRSHLGGGLRLPRGVSFGLFGFLLFSNLYLQYFDLEFYTPHINIAQIQSFDYHKLTKEVENYFTGETSKVDNRITILLSSIPDPYLDLRDEPNLTLYQAIDPNYPIDEGKYKKDLDRIDYVVYTWLPHEYLAYYVGLNAEKTETIEGGGYMVNIAKLRPKDQRN